MVKTRLYESEDDEVIKLINKSTYDAILLNNRPIDILADRLYRGILTKRKEGNNIEREDEWILKIFMKTKSGMWQLTPGQWYLSTLLGEDQYGFKDYREEDEIEIDNNWRVAGMTDVVQEALAKIDEYETKEEPKYTQNKDYSKMRKSEIEKIVNQAIDNKDYELLDKISKYLPESELDIWEDVINEAIKHLKPRSKNEILLNFKRDKTIKRKKKRPIRTFESLDETISIDDVLMGHNSPNPNDPEVNGLKNRIESEEDIEKIEENVVSVNERITKTYDHPLTHEEIKQMIGKILFKFQKQIKFKTVNNMRNWLNMNNFGDVEDNKWLRGIVDTLFKRSAGTWISINTEKSIDELTNMVMNYWKNKLTKESFDKDYMMPKLSKIYEVKDKEDDENEEEDDEEEKSHHEYMRNVIYHGRSEIPKKYQDDFENSKNDDECNEGCGCGGTKKPRGPMTPGPKRPISKPKLYKDKDDLLMSPLFEK